VPLTQREREEQRGLLERLRLDAQRLAAEFGLPLRALDAERPQVRRRYGICYSDGSIRIRLRHARTGRLLRYSALIDTLCHELAHLQHFNHGSRFRVLYRRILERARARGIYRPVRRGSSSSRQRAESASGSVTDDVIRRGVAPAVLERRDRPKQLDLFSFDR
jgi:predicted metal-dependent hydrolase